MHEESLCFTHGLFGPNSYDWEHRDSYQEPRYEQKEPHMLFSPGCSFLQQLEKGIQALDA